MLKLAKWAYDLGVRHERVRIAAHLQLEGQRANNSRDVAMDMLRESSDKKFSKSRAEKLEFSIAVNDRVQAIINDMFDSKGDWIAGASIMFPDDKHKGEIK